MVNSLNRVGNKVIFEPTGRTADHDGKGERGKGKEFLSLAASVRASNNRQAVLHASFLNKKQRMALKEWHGVLGHIDPAAIKHLEKRGLINIMNAIVASEMRCVVLNANIKSQALSWGWTKS